MSEIAPKGSAQGVTTEGKAIRKNHAGEALEPLRKAAQERSLSCCGNKG